MFGKTKNKKSKLELGKLITVNWQRYKIITGEKLTVQDFIEQAVLEKAQFAYDQKQLDKEENQNE